MDNTVAKLDMWRKKLTGLESDLEVAMQQKGEAAAMGDLSENAAYKMALEEIDMLRARMAEVKQIIADLEKTAIRPKVGLVRRKGSQ